MGNVFDVDILVAMPNMCGFLMGNWGLSASPCFLSF